MNDSMVYVVTRNGRRIEDKNYTCAEEARHRAGRLRGLLKHWNDRDASAVKVTKTDKPNRIR
jgi:hypothetical protein